MSKIEKSEQPRVATIMPSEHTHFRVIMDNGIAETTTSGSSEINNTITVFKPQPRTQRSPLLETSAEQAVPSEAGPAFLEDSSWPLEEQNEVVSSVTNTLDQSSLSEAETSMPAEGGEVFQATLQPETENPPLESNNSPLQQTTLRDGSAKTDEMDKKKGK